MYTKQHREKEMKNIEEMDDRELCQMVSEGNREAEEILVIRYGRLVRICARPYFLVGGDSEDLIQEGMLGLLKAVRGYDASRDASFYTFAEVCIRSRLYTVLRKQSRSKRSALDLETPFFDRAACIADASDISCSNPEDLIILRENIDEIYQCVQKYLSPFEARVLGLYLDGLSYGEIAETVHKTSKSVDNAVQRIRRKIAQQFDHGAISKG